MQLPNGVEWTAHCLVVLEQFGSTQPVPSAALAEAYGLSPTYLNKHLQKLAANGLVTSTPGQAGGFALARPAQEITLADVVDALDGRGPIFRCTEIRCQGLFKERSAEIKASGPCRIASAMRQAEDAWRSSLSQVSITDLAAGVDAHSRQQLSEFIDRKHPEGEHQP
ncbi:RrF2 family transcriptional regulator [Micrococcus luteus]|jgi:Rrf2 family protein|nr:Rrf2 family transcriptional regulator [Micrococcus luteus]AJO56596.1 Rrf2 family transcriptional regulator [Micrococcus luteus]